METCCSESVQGTKLKDNTAKMMADWCSSSPEMCDHQTAQTAVVLKNNLQYQMEPGCSTKVEQANAEKKTKPSRIKDISPVEAYDLIQKNRAKPDFVVLDVRTEQEYKNGHLENAVLMDFFSAQFGEQLADLDRNRTYLVYCKIGCRSKIAQERMEKQGFKMVYNVSGGKDRWVIEDIPF